MAHSTWLRVRRCCAACRRPRVMPVMPPDCSGGPRGGHNARSAQVLAGAVPALGRRPAIHPRPAHLLPALPLPTWTTARIVAAGGSGGSVCGGFRSGGQRRGILGKMATSPYARPMAGAGSGDAKSAAPCPGMTCSRAADAMRPMRQLGGACGPRCYPAATTLRAPARHCAARQRRPPRAGRRPRSDSDRHRHQPPAVLCSLPAIRPASPPLPDCAARLCADDGELICARATGVLLQELGSIESPLTAAELVDCLQHAATGWHVQVKALRLACRTTCSSTRSGRSSCPRCQRGRPGVRLEPGGPPHLVRRCCAACRASPGLREHAHLEPRTQHREFRALGFGRPVVIGRMIASDANLKEFVWCRAACRL